MYPNDYAVLGNQENDPSLPSIDVTTDDSPPVPPEANRDDAEARNPSTPFVGISKIILDDFPSVKPVPPEKTREELLKEKLEQLEEKAEEIEDEYRQVLNNEQRHGFNPQWFSDG